MKKFNSVATLAFTVQHDDEDKITEAEFTDAITKRISDLNGEPDGYEQACGSDWFDTQPNETINKPKFKVMAFMTTPLYIEVEAETEEEAVAIAKAADGADFTPDLGGDWDVADNATAL